MERTGFVYKVLATITVTRAELEVLSFASRQHYDSKCRSLCGVASSQQGTKNGTLTIWRIFYFEDVEGPPNPNEIASVEVDSHVVDTLIKTTEQFVHAGPYVQETIALHMKLRGIMHALNTEWRRLNEAPVE
jgi:hypothetical protein